VFVTVVLRFFLFGFLFVKKPGAARDLATAQYPVAGDSKAWVCSMDA